MAALIFGMIVLWLGICMGLSLAAARSVRRQMQTAIVPTEAQLEPVPLPQG